MAKKYEQVKQYLLENIKNGTYVPERPLPPERELALLLGVNRMTVRRAEEELMYDGYLIRKKGSGTYLTQEKVRKDELIGDPRDSMRLISAKYCRDGNYGCRMLGLKNDGTEGYWRIRRVRYLDMLPCAYEDIYLREEFFREVDSSFYTIGLHEMIQEKAGESHPFRQQQVEALLCLKTTASLLNMKAGAPVLQIKTWFYTEEDKQLMLYSRSYHPGDSYRFRTRLVRIK